MTDYNLILELAKRNPTDDDVDVLMDAFEDFHPAVTISPLGWVEVIITVQAETLRQAIAVGLGLAGDVVSVTGMTTAEFDRRPVDVLEIPEFVSVSEAAQWLGITRQAVQQRIDAGKIPARKIGPTWAILAPAVERLAAAAVATVAGLGVDSAEADSHGRQEQMAKGDIDTFYEDGKWKNQTEGRSRAASTHTTKTEAVEAGRDMARRRKVEHVIKKQDGTIGEKNSYGNDPRNVKG